MAALACALAYASTTRGVSAQEARDPLIVPQAGDNGSRFQIVGQFGWTPGETVTIQLGLSTADPFNFAGPFYHERQITVLRDGTWSFPIAVNDQLFPFPLGSEPQYIIVSAQSASKTAINAFVYAPAGRQPAGAEAIAHLGFGPDRASAVALVTAALFVAATGALLIASGIGRASYW
jgi:hypothetical protein